MRLLTIATICLTGQTMETRRKMDRNLGTDPGFQLTWLALHGRGQGFIQARKRAGPKRAGRMKVQGVRVAR
jgi:hypothetical protein